MQYGQYVVDAWLGASYWVVRCQGIQERGFSLCFSLLPHNTDIYFYSCLLHDAVVWGNKDLKIYRLKFSVRIKLLEHWHFCMHSASSVGATWNQY